MKAKYIFGFIFVLGIFMGFCNVNASAATEGYYTYTVSGGEATITDFPTNLIGCLQIPNTLGGYPVTAIGNSAFSGCIGLTRIIIPNGVTSIGDSAFSYCDSLREITIPVGVTYIGSHAFYNCDALTDIVIPGTVTSISDYMFYGCDALTDATLNNGVARIGKNVFNNCQNLQNIYIPKTVQEVMGFCAIYNCYNLETIYYGGDNWYDIYDNKYNLHLDGCGTVSIQTGIDSMNTRVSEDGKTITVSFNYTDSGDLVILALYSGDTLVEMQKAIYESKEITFTTNQVYDCGKVMIWKDLKSAAPVYKNDTFGEDNT